MPENETRLCQRRHRRLRQVIRLEVSEEAVVRQLIMLRQRNGHLETLQQLERARIDSSLLLRPSTAMTGGRMRAQGGGEVGPGP